MNLMIRFIVYFLIGFIRLILVLYLSTLIFAIFLDCMLIRIKLSTWECILAIELRRQNLMRVLDIYLFYLIFF
jgi:hypothetical protein